MAEIVYKDESFKIIGACMRVHAGLGGGFLENVYHEALESEFHIQSIPYESQKKLVLFYNDVQLKKFYKADFLCYDKIIIELKAVDYVTVNMRNQLIYPMKFMK